MYKSQNLWGQTFVPKRYLSDTDITYSAIGKPGLITKKVMRIIDTRNRRLNRSLDRGLPKRAQSGDNNTVEPSLS